MSHFEKFATDGSEKTDELAKAGPMLEEGFLAETRAKTVQQERERERRGVCSLAVRSQFPLLGGRMARLCRAQAEAKRKMEFRGQEE